MPDNIYFLLLQSPLLEEIILEDNIIEFKELKQIIDKICPLKFLKKIHLKLCQNDKKNLPDIFCQNKSIKEINIQLYYKENDDNKVELFKEIQVSEFDFSVDYTKTAVNSKNIKGNNCDIELGFLRYENKNNL